jgi:hypothetical protein
MGWKDILVTISAVHSSACEPTCGARHSGYGRTGLYGLQRVMDFAAEIRAYKAGED